MAAKRTVPRKGPAKKMPVPKARKVLARPKNIKAKKSPASAVARKRSVKAVAPQPPALAQAATSIPPAPPSPPIAVAVPVMPPAPLQWRALAAFFAFAIAITAVCGFIIRSVDAATFQGPSAAPPGGNIPITIWNRASSGTKQTSASIDIDGGIVAEGMVSLGSVTAPTLTGTQNLVYGNINNASASTTSLLLLQRAATNMFKVDRNGAVTAASMQSYGSAALALTGTQNLIYGNVDTTSSATTALMLLQNESADRFRVDVAGNVTAAGKVKGAGCFGKTLVGLTTANYHGGLGAVTSYYAADNRCNTDFPGSHVCRVEEILESISCSVPGDPIRTNGGNYAWINGGTPGDPSKNANDCIGWTDNSAAAFGRLWIFDNTNGGRGTLTSCNSPPTGAKFACCK